MDMEKKLRHTAEEIDAAVDAAAQITANVAKVVEEQLPSVVDGKLPPMVESEVAKQIADIPQGGGSGDENFVIGSTLFLGGRIEGETLFLEGDNYSLNEDSEDYELNVIN